MVQNIIYFVKYKRTSFYLYNLIWFGLCFNETNLHPRYVYKGKALSTKHFSYVVVSFEKQEKKNEFLAGRLAGREGAYFYEESKQVVSRFVEKHKITPTLNQQNNLNHIESSSSKPDVLPEVLKHSLPLNITIYHNPSSNNPTTAVSKWVLHTPPPSGSSSVSAEALNPLRAYVSLPQVTFGSRRWNLPNVENSGLASTANDLRPPTPINPDKLKAMQEGHSQIAKAFAVASAAIFCSGALIFGLVASKFDLHNSDDIQTKVRDLVKPQFDRVREKLVPARTWAENMSKRWQTEKEQSIKAKPIFIQKLSKVWGAKSSSN